MRRIRHPLHVQFKKYHMQYAEDFLKTSAYTLDNTKPLSVDVLICGAGLVGSSVAYHLAQRTGLKVLLMEQGRWERNYKKNHKKYNLKNR